MHLPPGCLPVLVASYTASGMLRTATYLNGWPTGLPRPWLVVVRDAPLRPPEVAVYRRRALGARVLGVSEVPYLYQLRAVDGPELATQRFRPVARAAARLRADLGV